MKSSIIFLICIFLHCSALKSQTPTEQDCLGAVLLCDPIYSTTNPGYGMGNYPNEVGPGTCQLFGEINSLWFKFTILSSGDLAFTITPASNMDYDWALYNLTYASCEDVLTNGMLLSSCNSTQFAITGISSTGDGNWNTFGLLSPAFNYLLSVDSGELYYLQVSNWDGAPGGFTIDFTASTAILDYCNPVSFGAVQTSICEKFCTDLFDSSLTNPTSWQWIFEGGIPGTSTLQNPTNICYYTSGTYDVTLITTSISGIDTLLLPDYITVSPTPTFPTITQTGSTLIASLAASYLWQFNSVDIPGATNQTYNVTQSGFYTVIISDSNGCVNSATAYVEVTGIEDFISEAEILLFPNPASNSFTIQLLNYVSTDDVSIDMKNAVGQTLISFNGKIYTNDWKKDVNLSDSVSGIYFIEVSSTNLFLREKLAIMR